MPKNKAKHPLVKVVAKVIAEQGLLHNERPVIVAVSGGADSVALLACLLELGYECVAAHCNFHLRGEESMRDMHFVESLSQQLSVDLHIRDFDVDERMKATGESVEMACRELRYAWFNDLLEKNYAQAIAVGHHREDNVETFMLNLLRSTGIAGLTGMRYRNGLVIRPMLDCTRAEIEDYLKYKSLDFIVDSSNNSNDYKRNKIRNVLLPMLEKLSPGAMDAVVKTMANLNDNREVYDDVVKATYDKYYDSDKQTINVAELVAAEPRARILLYEILRQNGFNMTQVDNILAAGDASGLTFDAPSGVRAELSRGVLHITSHITDLHDDEVEVSLNQSIVNPIGIEITTHQIAEFKPERDAAVMYLDSAALDGNPRWTIRPWRRGDRIAPFGLPGTKLLSDVFADAKLTQAQKRDVRVLTRDGVIVWVIGLRASKHFAVTKSTTSYLQLRCLIKNNL
jgi:tRNA(Ile)-lysidine synthase